MLKYIILASVEIPKYIISAQILKDIILVSAEIPKYIISE